jgi:ElaB/YqjD/DUF883 family membrane-anchored ribosome-binding protein
VSDLHTNAPSAAEPANGQGAPDKAQEVAGRAQDKAQEAAGQAKSRIRSEVDGRSTQAGERLRSSAGDARSVADELRKQGKDQPAELAERAADRVERLGSYLHESDGDKILRDVEDFARQRPWAVVAGGLALGLAASRFLKASSSRRYQGASAPPYNGPTTPSVRSEVA